MYYFYTIIAVFGFKLNIETGLILALSYGFLAMGSKQPFMDMLELLKVSIYKSTKVIILLSSVGIFMHAVKTPEVVDLMAPLLLHLMPKSPTQCLLFSRYYHHLFYTKDLSTCRVWGQV